MEALISQSILGHKYTSNVLKSSRELVLVISTSCTGIEMDDVVQLAVPLGTVLFFLMLIIIINILQCTKSRRSGMLLNVSQSDTS